jgi:hypothetical protein
MTFVEVLSLGVLIGLVALPARGDNLVGNPGFEEGAAGWSLAELYAVDSTVAHTGKQSLRYHNVPGGPYLLARRAVPLRPGKCYRISAWVKTDRVESAETGATLCLEWHSAEGYLGGAYPPGITGTSDWRQIVYETGMLPDEVTGGGIVVYGRSGTSGTAWFDDVEVTELPEPLARFSFADAPGAAKQVLFEGPGATAVRIRAVLSPARGVAPESLRLSAKLQAPGYGKEVDGTWEGGLGELRLPPEQLPWGESQVEVTLSWKESGAPVTGTTLTVEKRRLVRMDLVEPNPAGVVGLRPGEERVAVRLSLARQEPGKSRRYQARLSLLSEGKVLRRGRLQRVGDSQPTRLSLSLAGVAPGQYDLRCDLFGEGAATPVARAEALISRVDPARRPANTTWFGPQRMLMVEDKPFFPIGFYILSSFESVFPVDQPYRWITGALHPSYYLPILDRLAGSHFNTVLDYGSTMGGVEPARQFLDAVHARGLRAIFSVKDLMEGAYWQVYTRNLPWKDLREANWNVVRALRDHPSLIAWYINDEVFQPDKWQSAVNVFRDTRAEDPWHPTYAVHYDYPRVGIYRDACDVIGTDPYTLLDDIGLTARSWRECRAQIGPDQPFWAVVQCFGPGYETSRPVDTREPSYDEERAATMAAIAEGATGIIFYCWHSLERSPRFAERFAELNRIAGEVQSLVPILSLPSATPGARVEQGTLSILTKRGKGKSYVLLASTERGDQDVVLRLPFRPKQVRDVQSGEVLTTTGQRLALRFRALDARVLEIR